MINTTQSTRAQLIVARSLAMTWCTLTLATPSRIWFKVSMHWQLPVDIVNLETKLESERQL